MNQQHGERDHQTTGEPSLERLRHVQGALVWEADAWAVHFSLLSEASTHLLGISSEECEAERTFFKRFVHPSDWCSLLETLHAAAAEGGIRTCRHRMIRSDGSTLWAQTSAHRSLRSNGAPILTGITVDITDVVKEEETLREAVGTSRLLIQNLREHGLFMVSLDGNISTWNPGAQQLKGYTAEEVIGTHISCFFPEPERTNGIATKLLEKAELERQSHYEGWLVRKGGSRFWASLTLAAVTDEGGRLRGYANISRDLTARKRAEQALARSEEELRLLVESVQDYGVFMVSPDGLVENWNRGAQRLKGYRAHEIVGSPLSRFFPPEEIERGTPDRLLEAAELRGSATYEGQLVRKDGSRFWTTCTLAAVEDATGRLRGFSNVSRDVTERKHAEDTLRESEERLRLLVDSLQDYAIFMVSPAGYVASWSRGAERMKGHSAEAIIGAPLSRLFPSDEVENGTPLRLIEQATLHGRVEYEGLVLHASGSTLWANVILSAVKDPQGTLRGFSYVAKDLTERRRADKAQAFLADIGTVLADSLDYRTTCDSICRLAIRGLARSCFVVLHSEGSVEPVAMADVDVSREERLRAAMHRVAFVPGHLHGADDVLQAGQAKIIADASEAAWLPAMLGIDDAELARDIRTGPCMLVPLRTGGNVFGMIALLAQPGSRYSDTDLRVSEELARRAALALDNIRLFEEAQTAIAMREEVLTVVSHDLRNPLSTILVGAEQLLKRSQDAATLKVAQTVKRASGTMTRMIQDLLDFSSIERGRLRLELASHDAASLVKEAVEAQRPLAEEKGIMLRAEVGARGVAIRGDHGRLMQVFSNLIGNAIKFVNERASISVRSAVEGGQVIFSVRDTGPGIPQDELPHVFERYWRSGSHTRESLGLGLAITKGIVESHGGSIWVVSKVGEETSFYFALPIFTELREEIPAHT